MYITFDFSQLVN